MSSLLNTASASDLPFEIWHHISQFLTERQLKKMYGVNRAFFYIGMALRYREIQIGVLNGPGVKKCLYISQHLPEMKEHIRSLVLTPVLFEFSIPDESEKRQQPSESTINLWEGGIWDRLATALHYLQSQTSQRRRPSDIVYFLKSFIRSLDRVTELTIDSQFNHALIPNSACSLTLLGAGWHAFGQSLRSLALKGDVSLLESVLEEPVHLARLESLSIEIGRNKYGVDVGAAFSALTQFVVRHYDTLTTLGIVWGDIVNFDWFSRGLGQLPRLQRLKVRQPPFEEHWYRPTAQQLILGHIDSITDLDWGYTDIFLPYKDNDNRWSNSKTDTQTPFDLTFPHIRRFSVCGSCPGVTHLKNAISFVGRHHKTLTNLSFASWVLSPGQLDLLIRAAASPAMREFEVGVDLLTSRVFATLAAQFPYLEVLGLSYDKTGRMLAIPAAYDSDLPIPSTERPNATHSVYGLVEFKEDMGSLEIGGWPVGTLNIWKCAHSDRQEYRTESVGKVIVARLPRVGFVNGLYREHFVSFEPEKTLDTTIFASVIRR